MSGVARLWLFGSLALAGCAAEAERETEYLDQRTGVTVRATAAPMIYARDAPELAANVRDYQSLGAVEIINMSSRKQYLVLVSWSTVDRARAGVAPAPVAERIALSLAGQRRELSPIGHDARSLGISEPPFRPASGYVGESWYAVSPADLRALAAAAPGSIELLHDAETVSYVTWRRADEAFKSFVRELAN